METSHTTSAPASQDVSASTSSNRLPLRTIVAYCAVWVFIIVSAGIGGVFGYTLGERTHIVFGLAFAAVAIAAEILKPYCVAGIFNALRRWNIPLALVCLLLSTVIITYSIASELTVSAMLRGDQTAERASKVETLADARARKARAEADIAALGTHRSIGEIKAQRDGLLAKEPRLVNCNAWVPVPVRVICADTLSPLDAEMARAQRHGELDAIVREAQGVIGASVKVKDADPLASAVSALAATFGWKVSLETVAAFATLLIPALVELGSAFGLMVVDGAARSARPVAGAVATVPAPAMATVTTERAAVDAEAVATPPEPGQSGVCPPVQPVQPPAQPGPNAGARQRVLDIITEAGGTIHGGQRALASKAGVSTTRLRQVLDNLTADGLVKVRAGTTSTAVQLVAGPAVAGEVAA